MAYAPKPKWGYNNHTITMSDYGATPSQFGVVTPSRAQLAQQREAESYTRAAAAQMKMKEAAKKYRFNKNLPIFNARFPPKKLSRTRSRPSSRTRSRSNKSRKRSRHSV
uniref:Uncharacterized protein n=1 Tax=viral metagenome TaxID=1070528 RepID=A0A6C0M0Z3_9ZZZZ